MEGSTEVDERPSPGGRLGGKALLLIVLFHALGLAVATFPMILKFRSTLPEAFDSLQHIWLMRWYKSCLWEGKSVFHCPQIQYPVGAALGSFSPLHLQSLLFLPLSSVFGDDLLSYNIVWSLGLLLMGVGTSLLVWETLHDRRCAAFGGLLAMLSGPMTAHAHGHLELIYAGTFPLFLVAWMRFVDRPSGRRLTWAVLGYVLIAMSAAYFMVFAVFPAVLYVVWRAAGEGWHKAWSWLRGRSPWFVGFAAGSLPCLLLLFSGHLWAVGQGHSLTRSREEFNHFGAPFWSYLCPTPEHRLSSLLPSSLCSPLDEHAVENTSYLGLVTIGLLVYAACYRVGVRRGAYLWWALGLTFVLSLGATCKVAGITVSLPSAWLWAVFPPYRLTRVPARFNLFAGVLAGTLAAAGLRHLLARLPWPRVRTAVFTVLAALALADLAVFPFWSQSIPGMPPCYTFLNQRDPKATILEIPYLGTGGSFGNAARTYWQSIHGLTTSAGYSGFPNVQQEAILGLYSPFALRTLELPADAEIPTRTVCSLDLEEYLWLSLTVHRFDYLVLHQAIASDASSPILLDRMKALLSASKIYEDGVSIVYERARLKPPLRPLVLIRDGWRPLRRWQGRWNGAIGDRLQLSVYNPDPNQDLRLTLDASAFNDARSVRVRAGAEILTQCDVFAGSYQSRRSTPFRLPVGLHDLTLESFALDAPPHARHEIASRGSPAYSLRIARMDLTAAEGESIAERDRGNSRTLVKSIR